MCLAIPVKVVEVGAGDTAIVDLGGVKKEISLALLSDVNVGDYVILHVHNVREPGTRGRAIIDIFKFENGKIVEHWDVAQDIPEKMPHNNGMF